MEFSGEARFSSKKTRVKYHSQMKKKKNASCLSVSGCGVLVSGVWQNISFSSRSLLH